jgi:hypothetical protein
MANLLKNKPFKFTLLGIGIFLISAIIIMLIWWNGYIPPVHFDKLALETPVAQAIIPSGSGSPLRGILVGITEEKTLPSMDSGIKRAVAKVGLRLAFPVMTQAYVFKPAGAETPVYLYAIDFGKGIKLVRFVQDRINARILGNEAPDETVVQGYTLLQRKNQLNVKGFKDINAGAWIGTGLLLCSDPAYLKNVLDRYPEAANTGSVNAATSDIHIHIDNQSGYLGGLIRYYEQKYSFEMFSTIDKVSEVDINLTPVKDNALKGNIVFKSKTALTEEDTLVNDVDFFYGVLRRLLRPQGIEMGGETRKENEAINLQVELTGFKTALSQIEKYTAEDNQ